ncbi:MAG: flagella cluster protein [Halobacterium sp.]
MGERLDFESIRHRVKLLRDSGDERVFENRDDVACPVCGDAFAEALASSGRTCQLSPSDVDLCLVREDDRVVVFTHA